MDEETNKRLTNLFYSLKQRGEREFTKQEFIEWYKNNEVNGCYYCGLEIVVQRELIQNNKIESNRFFSHKYFNQYGLEKNGTRGFNFEVDRKKPKGPYSEDNCVLCCYFCNNDKSDVFSDEQYKIFIGANGKDKKDNPRYKYLKSLISTL